MTRAPDAPAQLLAQSGRRRVEAPSAHAVQKNPPTNADDF
jgi:hypothetical protein